MKLIIFLCLSTVSLLFFAFPAEFLNIAFPIGGLYYFVLLGLFQALSQAFAISDFYYLSLGDSFFSITLGTTSIGYFYILSSYLTFVVRRIRKADAVGLIMLPSIAMIFLSPYLILSHQSTAASQGAEVSTFNIIDEGSCVSFPVESGTMEWHEDNRTCLIRGSFIVTGNDIVGIASNVTLVILPGGNLTTVRYINNNGTIMINGGILQNIDGYIHNSGLIHHKNGVFNNSGILDSDVRFDGIELPRETPRIINMATIENRQYIYNHGDFNNSGLLINSGEIQFFGGSSVYNNGTMLNNGRMEVAGQFDNTSEILNSGKLIIYHTLQSSFLDDYSGTVLNNFGEIVNTVGQLYNSGIINNHGSISNQVGDFHNLWDDSKAVINNNGAITNISGEFINEGIINNDCNGSVRGKMLGNRATETC